MSQVVEEKNTFLSLFADKEKQFSGDPSWVMALRHHSIANFGEYGFPTRRDEGWRFTNVKEIKEQNFQLASPKVEGITPEALKFHTYHDLDAHTLVFINGHYSAEHSSVGDLQEGLLVKNLASAIEFGDETVKKHLGKLTDYKDKPFASLNGAFFRDGVFIHVPPGMKVHKPIQTLFLTVGNGNQPVASFPRNLVVIGDRAQVSWIETYASIDHNQVYLNAPVTEFVAGADIELDHYRVDRESRSAWHLSMQHSRIKDDAHFRSHAVFIGGKLNRYDLGADLDGEHIDAIMNGLYMLSGDQHADVYMQINHNQPNCDSHELYKGILEDKGHGVFRGRIYVNKIAQKTDAKQTSQNLLLSDDAQINAMPQLEIFADDVKCTHGATIGQLDPDALFYLRSRGIDKTSAQNLLIHAFASDILDRVHIEEVRESLEKFLDERLPH